MIPIRICENIESMTWTLLTPEELTKFHQDCTCKYCVEWRKKNGSGGSASGRGSSTGQVKKDFSDF